MKTAGKILTIMRKLRFYEVLLLFFIALVLGAWSVKEITESAIFCGSTCHIMRPFYEDWKTSSHNQVRCVDCHLPPSDDQQFVPQFKAVGQVASYLTRTYGDRTRAEVSDASCLTEACHSRRLLDGRVSFAGNITFDHTPHLQRLRRGKVLRCTTCHSRVAMGEHVTVVEDPCFLCHFKEVDGKPPTADCTLCHDPARISAGSGDNTFDHGPFSERGVACESCHEGVTRGQGGIRSGSCQQCHEAAMDPFLDEPVELLHRSHVTDHKVNCSSCHEPIIHSRPDPSLGEALDCNSCHESRHVGILNLYRGTGAAGVPDDPSPMYRAHVGCLGCHRVPRPGAGPWFEGRDMIAVSAACTACHGEDRSGEARRWSSRINEALSRAERALVRADGRLGDASHAPPAARRILEQARHNIAFIRSSSPIHNSDYAVTVLEKATRDLDGLTKTP
ncbi:MAG: NapC/NirT family cytochrome c [bacterium]|nr:MAG: NapC/NirT family cytochrome c [bacterium]